jgi:hypothetical protein
MDQYIFNEHEVKKVIFGYGAVRFSVNSQVLTLIEIKPPVGAGTRIFDDNYEKIGDWEDTGRRISIMFNNFDEVKKCEHWLDQIEAGNLRSFAFKDVIFDYTTFHESGLILMRRGLHYVKMGLCLLTAC